MQRTLVSLGISIIFLFFSFNKGFGQDIKFLERIEVDPGMKFQATPESFCVTEDEDRVLLLPDSKRGTINVFIKEKNFLKFVKSFGRSGLVGKELGEPVYCTYNQEFAKLAVINFGLVRKITIYDRTDKFDFKLMENIPCNNLGSDVKFTGNGNQIIVSGYETDKANKPYDLYLVNTITAEIIKYLLPSHEKYGLKNNEDYINEYYKKQTLPAIGINGYIDIQGDNLYFVWEGAVRIIKMSLSDPKKSEAVAKETAQYKKTSTAKLIDSYMKGDFSANVADREAMQIVINIFTTSNHLFLVYKAALKPESNEGRIRLKKYTLEGTLLSDVVIPENPGSVVSFDKKHNELFVISDDSKSDKANFSILRYKILTK